ncbi:MAG: peptidase [Alphaproteobacteria bacterium]|nr:MAG: peptidase [Alphaproteobacteria bacterium]
MDGGISWILIAILAAALAVAAFGDWRTRIIPNRLNAAIALLAIPYWWSTGVSLSPGILLHVAVAAAVFAIFTLAFVAKAMGGGDVKLVAAVALWLPPFAVVKLLLLMSIAGGLLTVAMLIRHRMSKRQEELEIPYGVAIAFGGFWLISERFLNHFG